MRTKELVHEVMPQDDTSDDDNVFDGFGNELEWQNQLLKALIVKFSPIKNESF